MISVIPFPVLTIPPKVSVWIDNIEDIEEAPDTAQILCTFDGKKSRPSNCDQINI